MRYLMLGLVPLLLAASPPNVVVIFTDDLGRQDLGCYGRAEHRTPNLDQLAREGVRLLNAYAAASICSPSRAALMTGQAPARLHLTTFLPGRADAPSQKLLHPKIATHLPDTSPTLPGLLKAAGYATGCFGKWHLGGKGHLPTDHGFGTFFAGKANTSPSDTEGGKGEFELTAKAIQFLRTQAQAKKPFFLYLAHNTPHIPYTAKAQLIQQNAAAFEPTYAAVIQTLDETVGLLLTALKELQLEQNTLVIFTSDNGGLHVPELQHKRITHCQPYRAGKGFLYEGGIRVPLLIRHPASIPGGRTLDTLTITQDLVPTILEACGVKPPEMDGLSILSELQGKAAKTGRTLSWHQPHYTNQGGRPASALRQGDWKLIHHHEEDQLELFNLAQDAGEQKNLAAQEAELTRQLNQQLQTWLKATKAQRMTVNPNFDAARHRRLYVDFDPSRYDPRDAKQEPAALAWRREMDEVVRKK